MVALALRTRLCTTSQRTSYKNAWYNLKGILSVDPSITVRHSDGNFLLEALPELNIAARKGVGLVVYLSTKSTFKVLSTI